MPDRFIKVRGGCQRLIPAGRGRTCSGLREKSCYLRFVHQAKRLYGNKGLIEHFLIVNTGNDDRRWKVERIVQAFERINCFALKNDPVCAPKRFHSENSDLLFLQLRHHELSEAAEVGVQQVQRHLYAVELKPILRRHLKHIEMNPGILVPGKTDMANFPGLFGGQKASIAPPSANMRSASSNRRISWCCNRSRRSVLSLSNESLSGD